VLAETLADEDNLSADQSVILCPLIF